MSTNHRKSVHIPTLGCKMNAYEFEAMLELSEKAGYQVHNNPEEVSDIYIINTCIVANLSDRKNRQFTCRGKRANPWVVMAIVGCHAQTSSDQVGAMEDVDLVLGTKDRNEIVDYIKEILIKR